MNIMGWLVALIYLCVAVYFARRYRTLLASDKESKAHMVIAIIFLFLAFIKFLKMMNP